MAIILRLDRVMADRKMSLNELSEKVGISNVNLSNLKTVLDCQPGDIIEYRRTSGAEYRAKNITDNPADIPDTAHPDCSKNSK